jgi:hypothetical protein
MLRQLLDHSVMRLLRIRFIDRLAGYVTYQRKRKSRRVVEQRLRQQGDYPCEVMRGPFKGMRFPDPECYIDSRFEKVFGAYEHELFPVIASLPDMPARIERVIVLGASDGFYAVGLGLLLPETSVIAFEMLEVRRRTLAAVAELNGVADRVIIHGMATSESLRLALTLGRSLVFCDVDGAERELLDPENTPELRGACILVETHDCFVKGVCDQLKSHFAPSHVIKEIFMNGPDFGFLPELAGLPMHEVDAMVGSDRPMLQTWLWMTPRSDHFN